MFIYSATLKEMLYDKKYLDSDEIKGMQIIYLKYLRNGNTRHRQQNIRPKYEKYQMPQLQIHAHGEIYLF